MKKIVKALLTAALLFGFCSAVWAAQPMSQRQYRKKPVYNKNSLPAAWRYEAGYAMWRVNRKMPLNVYTYKKYRKDKTWRYRMHRYYRPQELLLNTLDWTAEELALFMRRNQDYFMFHPSGFED